MRTSAEKLIELIRGMSEVEADKILYLVEGVRVGENAAEKTNAAEK